MKSSLEIPKLRDLNFLCALGATALGIAHCFLPVALPGVGMADGFAMICILGIVMYAYLYL